MHIRTVLALVVALLVVSVSGLSARETVKIGAIVPMSGDLTAYGAPVRDAMLLSMEDIARQPNRKFDYQLVLEDDQDQPANSALAAQKLVNVDKVDFVVGLWPASCYPNVPLYKRKYVPMMVLAVWDRKLADGRTTFALTTSIEKEFDAMLPAIRALGYKRVAIINGRDAGFDCAGRAAAAKAKEAGLDLVAHESFNPGEREFTTLILKIKEAKPDLLINLSADPEVFIIERRIKDLGLTCDVTTFEVYDATQDAPFAQGRWYVTCAQSLGDFPQEYAAKYHRAPEYATGFAYESLQLIEHAYEETAVGEHKPSAHAVVAWLNRIKDRPSSVGVLNIDRHGVIDTQPCLLYVDHGKSRPISVEELKKLRGVK